MVCRQQDGRIIDRMRHVGRMLPQWVVFAVDARPRRNSRNSGNNRIPAVTENPP